MGVELYTTRKMTRQGNNAMPLRQTALTVLLLYCASVSTGVAAEGKAPEKEAAQVVMRPPFKLTLHIDRERYYEENIGEIPYVYKGGVYLMKGDDFGATATFEGGKLSGISYEPDASKANITFKFEQNVEADGSAMMMLIIVNRTPHPLKMKAIMTVPGEKSAVETSILPVQAGLTNFESWPHAIVKLLLHDIEVGT